MWHLEVGMRNAHYACARHPVDHITCIYRTIHLSRAGGVHKCDRCTSV